MDASTKRFRRGRRMARKKLKKSEPVRIELDYRVEHGGRTYQGVVVGTKELTDTLLEEQEKVIKEMKENR